MRTFRPRLPQFAPQPVRSYRSASPRAALPSRRALLPISSLHILPAPNAGRVKSQNVITTASSFSPPASRTFHSSSVAPKGLIPESSDPQPRESEPDEIATRATPISIDDYHQQADSYLEHLVAKLEEVQERSGEIEVDYSGGVLTIEVLNKGTWVLNKQSPNRQVWLSSPVAGPKRYDWVVMGESMHQKEGGGTGDWIYLRDGSSLTSLIKKELGIELDHDTDNL